jgi:hypothetical protein
MHMYKHDRIIKVGDHDPNIHKNETELEPQVICCRNFDFLKQTKYSNKQCKTSVRYCNGHALQWLLGYC